MEGDSKYQISVVENDQLSRRDFRWMLELTKSNMQAHYESVGWNFDKKYDEIATTEYFLICKGIFRVGFVSWGLAVVARKANNPKTRATKPNLLFQKAFSVFETTTQMTIAMSLIFTSFKFLKSRRVKAWGRSFYVA